MSPVGVIATVVVLVPSLSPSLPLSLSSSYLYRHGRVYRHCRGLLFIQVPRQLLADEFGFASSAYGLRFLLSADAKLTPTSL